MSVIQEPEYNWSPDKMIEVSLAEPDDFLKVRETLTRIGVASRKEKKPVTSYTSKVSITSFTSRNCSLLTVSEQTLA